MNKEDSDIAAEKQARLEHWCGLYGNDIGRQLFWAEHVHGAPKAIEGGYVWKFDGGEVFALVSGGPPRFVARVYEREVEGRLADAFDLVPGVWRGWEAL